VVLPDPPAMVEAAVQAEAAGIFAVLVEGPPGTELVRAATVAAATRYIRVAVRLDLGADDPVTLAEEVAVVDNLANGRLAVVADGVPAETQALFRAALAGEDVRGVRIQPLPAQPQVPMWPAPPVTDLASLTAAAQGDTGWTSTAGVPVFVRGETDPAALVRRLAPPEVAGLAARFLQSGP
jgi:hypothetical protein